MGGSFPAIRDLAIIGNRRTAALLTHTGEIVWYCPGRFDRPSLLAALLDPSQGGSWKLNIPEVACSGRRYLEDSGILETTLTLPAGELQVTDWMPMGENVPHGICRQFSSAPTDIAVTLHPAPNYAERRPTLKPQEHGIQIDGQHYLYASHPLIIQDGRVSFLLPQGETGWSVLVDAPLTGLDEYQLKLWLEETLQCWQQISARITYRGPYEEQVVASIRVLRLLTFEDNGGIIAAPTTSLPEVIGGRRNYDYRYVWLRDAGMIVSALTRAGSDGIEERRFLDFICGYDRDSGSQPLMPFSTLDGKPAPPETTLSLSGYCHSRPVVIGNDAKDQLQLDAYGNVLLAAKLIYNRFDTREHWSLIAEIADFLADHWHEPDYGIWEEREEHQYTSSKVVVACGLKFIAEVSQNEAQAERWRTAEQAIRQFVAQHCLTSEGAYAVIAGSEAVDVTAALFPVWAYTEPDSPEMLATMRVLERDYATDHLYRRHLRNFDSQQEGAFLAGTFWVAQYWIMRQDYLRSQAIIDAALKFANDLGLFAEEADPKTGQMLGNFPQTFVHAAFIGAVIDLKNAESFAEME
ncbi:glycoside hydrolase family 15 protein [Pseudanabaena sp. FACHB-2040]|uniref:glycoside hydrolase family 15 protein n=1 Tax=Pseudanabaena sp. FACHB-2040 TaxID=2692859 RepID=UPI0016838888|nr:glycoside hydrolase family 15 protein [Pseudanabaena sp. FACHB-2040]MBD2256785.1 glycoside hydrolase family 15 protein [Pseudanabaena sp. FACHB-2040]